MLKVELVSGEMLHGIFIGFFHGDPGRGEPFIFMWRFVEEIELDDYGYTPGKYHESGRIIRQSAIRNVEFK